MKVNDLQSALRGVDPRDLRKPEPGTTGKPASQPQQTADGDSLDISLSSHVSARSAESATGAHEAESDLSPARVAEIRGRIQSGFYSSPETLSVTAERMLNFYSR